MAVAYIFFNEYVEMHKTNGVLENGVNVIKKKYLDKCV